MDVEKLIDRLKNYSIKDKALLNLQTVKDAAEALEKLQAENESLKNKLHDSYQGHLLDVVIPRLEAELEKAKMARPIELTGKGAEAFALAAQLSETQQKLKEVTAERDAAIKELNGVSSLVDDLAEFVDREIHPVVDYNLYLDLRENVDAVSMFQHEDEWRGLHKEE